MGFEIFVAGGQIIAFWGSLVLLHEGKTKRAVGYMAFGCLSIFMSAIRHLG